MEAMLAMTEFSAAGSPGGVIFPTRLPRHDAAGRLERIDAHHRARADVEHFICQRFRRHYGARVTQFSPQLMAERDASLRWRAAVGYAPACERTPFLEQYLDAPVEVVLASAFGVAVARDEVVEVGNLAADSPGAARRVIHYVTHHLHQAGFRWVVFTATRALANSFRRLHLTPTELAPADPARLPDGGARWGSYYAHDPRVMGGSIAWGYERLPGLAG
jgi:hypothetical protein